VSPGKEISRAFRRRRSNTRDIRYSGQSNLSNSRDVVRIPLPDTAISPIRVSLSLSLSLSSLWSTGVTRTTNEYGGLRAAGVAWHVPPSDLSIVLHFRSRAPIYREPTSSVPRVSARPPVQSPFARGRRTSSGGATFCLLPRLSRAFRRRATLDANEAVVRDLRPYAVLFRCSYLRPPPRRQQYFRFVTSVCFLTSVSRDRLFRT